MKQYCYWYSQKAFLSDQCKGIEEKNSMGKTRNPFMKIGDIKGKFHSRMGTMKRQKWQGPKRNRRD